MMVNFFVFVSNVINYSIGVYLILCQIFFVNISVSLYIMSNHDYHKKSDIIKGTICAPLWMLSMHQLVMSVLCVLDML